MVALFRFLASYEIFIYIILSVGLAITLRWLWQAYGEWRIAYYGLEKQLASRHLSSSIAAAGLIVMLVLSELCIVSFLVPTLPGSTFQPTPTVNLLVTQNGTPTPASNITVVPGEVPFGAVGCVPGQVVITSPAPGESVSGSLELIGTADVPNFGFYKYEVVAQGSENWATISAGRNVVRNGTLGRWDTSELTPGDYQLGLVVTDNQGTVLPRCIIPVRVTGNQ
jgi:hypothetical protein